MLLNPINLRIRPKKNVSCINPKLIIPYLKKKREMSNTILMSLSINGKLEGKKES